MNKWSFILAFFCIGSASAQFNCMDTKQLTQGSQSLSINNNAKSDTFNIAHYDIQLNLYGIAQQEFKAQANIDFIAKLNGLSRLNLDLWKLQVDSVQYFPNMGAGSNAFTFSYNDSLLQIDFQQLLNTNDSGRVTIFYQGLPQGDPSNWGGFHSDQGYYYNLGVGFGANPHTYGRAWFPCFDNFVEKSTYSLSLLSKSPLKPLLSGGQIQHSQSGDSIWSNATLRKPIPTYLVSFALANYEFLSDTVMAANGSLDILLAAKSGDTSNFKASFQNLKPTLHAFEGYFGPYQWPRLGYAATTVGAMEHATSIHYPISLINGNLSGEDIMAHELAHHWFGNLITCETSDDMWINEGMAEFSSHLYQESLYGKDRYLKTVRDNAWNVLHFAASRDGNEHRPLFGMPHEFVYGYHTYQKGAMVGHNLRHYLGDSIFFSSLQQLFIDHAYGNLSSRLFRDEMIRISGNADLIAFWDDWVFEPGYPQFSIDDWDYTALTQRVNLSIKQRLNNAPNFHNQVPVDLTFFAADGRTITRNLNHNGEISYHSGLLVPFEPIAILASYSGSLLGATGLDHLHFDSAGVQAAPYGGLTISTTNYSDSGSVIVMQHLVSAQKSSNNPFDFKLGKERYFTVQNLYFQNTVLEAELRFDGSNRGMDKDLLQNGNDSLVVLYRPKGSQHWNIYPHQVKNVSSSNSSIGSFTLHSLMSGDYVLANTKESLNFFIHEGPKAYRLFPNPVNDILSIEAESLQAVKVEIINASGKSLGVFNFDKDQVKEIDFSSYPSGVYLLIINGMEYKISKTKI